MLKYHHLIVFTLAVCLVIADKTPRLQPNQKLWFLLTKNQLPAMFSTFNKTNKSRIDNYFKSIDSEIDQAKKILERFSVNRSRWAVNLSKFNNSFDQARSKLLPQGQRQYYGQLNAFSSKSPFEISKYRFNPNQSFKPFASLNSQAQDLKPLDLQSQKVSKSQIPIKKAMLREETENEPTFLESDPFSKFNPFMASNIDFSKCNAKNCDGCCLYNKCIPTKKCMKRFFSFSLLFVVLAICSFLGMFGFICLIIFACIIRRRWIQKHRQFKEQLQTQTRSNNEIEEQIVHSNNSNSQVLPYSTTLNSAVPTHPQRFLQERRTNRAVEFAKVNGISFNYCPQAQMQDYFSRRRQESYQDQGQGRYEAELTGASTKYPQFSYQNIFGTSR